MPEGYAIPAADYPDYLALLRAWKGKQLVTKADPEPTKTAAPPGDGAAVVTLLERLPAGGSVRAMRMTYDGMSLGIDLWARADDPEAEPVEGTFILVSGSAETAEIPLTATAAELAQALKAIPALADRLIGVSLGKLETFDVRRWRIKLTRAPGETELPLEVKEESVPSGVTIEAHECPYHSTGVVLSVHAPGTVNSLEIGTEGVCHIVPGAGWAFVTSPADPAELPPRLSFLTAGDPVSGELLLTIGVYDPDAETWTDEEISIPCPATLTEIKDAIEAHSLIDADQVTVTAAAVDDTFTGDVFPRRQISIVGAGGLSTSRLRISDVDDTELIGGAHVPYTTLLE